MTQDTLRTHIINEALDSTVKEDKNIIHAPEKLVEKVWQKKIDLEIENFPKYCEEAYLVNYQAAKALRQVGIKGKYTDTYGWSEDGSMLAKYQVPLSLKMFMINLVYYDFWEDSNSKVRDSFMREICRGGCLEDYKLLLAKVVKHYGSDTGKLIEKVAA